MNILYFGTVCDLTKYEELLSNSPIKPSVAPIVFESSLLSGLKQNNAQVCVYSFPMIPDYKYTKKLWVGGKKEQLPCGYNYTWLRTVNIKFLKQISRRIDGKRVLKKWLEENKGQNCVILTYSIPPFLVKDIIEYSRKYNVKCFAIVTDLLRDMYVNQKPSFLKEKFQNFYLKQAIALQGKYDGYIYLVEEMKNVINPKKPYMVMEGIADISKSITVENTFSTAIMYAGMIEEKYGILNLIDAFEQANLEDVELWIYGSGNLEDKVKLRADTNPKIKFFGHQRRDDILRYEKQATLLVNPRSVTDDFTMYSFPSKTIEYMLSGTPVLTTKLKGIPEEYFKYLFFVGDNKTETLAAKLEEILNKTPEELNEFANKAANFIKSQKNTEVQAKRILEFITKTEENNANKVKQ